MIFVAVTVTVEAPALAQVSVWQHPTSVALHFPYPVSKHLKRAMFSAIGHGGSMSLFLMIGLLLLVAVFYVILWATARKLRVSNASCPACGHSVQGLVEPRCPECGSGLDRGVVRAGGIRPKPRRWLGFITLFVGLVSAPIVTGLAEMNWGSLLRMTGLIYMQTEFNRKVEVSINQTNQLVVMNSGAFTSKSNVVVTPGEVEVVMRSNDQDLATWEGFGPVKKGTPNGVLITGEEAVNSLRSQIPHDSDSPFAAILHDPEDSAILAKTIAAYSGNASVSANVQNSRGKPMFDGGISSSAGGSSGPVWPSAIWFAPIYVISGVIFLLYLLLALRILLYRRALQPFEPQASVP